MPSSGRRSNLSAPPAPGYQAPAWLPGGHLQTIYPTLIPRRPAIAYRRVRWELPDGDFLDLDWLHGPAAAPLVVLFHGLEGSSRSHYALALMAALRGRGWRGVVAHFRGCSGEPNRLPRAYHAGDSETIGAVLAHLRPLAGEAPLYAVGVSLGGNALLKWLGETGTDAPQRVQRAAAVSAPVDMVAAGQALDRGFNRLYARHFLASLKAKIHAKRQKHPMLLDGVDLEGIRSLHAFDEHVTAPLHGFLGAEDYWRRSSAKPWLPAITVPTLILHARNDPFLPHEVLPGSREVSPDVQLDYPVEGGHAGFMTGPFPGRIDWLPHRLIDFLETGL